MKTPFDHLKAPFKFTSGRILDAEGAVLAENIADYEFGRLVIGLLNGHFHVPVVFEARPIHFQIVQQEAK